MTEEPIPRVGSRVPIAAGQHICAMHFGTRDRDKVLLPFLGDGLARGDKCFTAVNEDDSADLVSKLTDLLGTEVDVSQSILRDQLEIKTSSDQVLSPDLADPAAVIEFWDTSVTSALTNGFGFVRLTAEASWWMPTLPRLEELIGYESELNRFTGKHPQAILCTYDLTQYNESIVLDLLKTHPIVLLSGIPIENPYYLTPDEFLMERSQGR